MYVCVCNAITDKQIRKAAESGTTDLWGLQAKLGVASGCGSCMEVASEILAEYHGRARNRERASREPVVYQPGLGDALPASA